MLGPPVPAVAPVQIWVVGQFESDPPFVVTRGLLSASASWRGSGALGPSPSLQWPWRAGSRSVATYVSGLVNRKENRGTSGCQASQFRLTTSFAACATLKVTGRARRPGVG